MSYSSQPRVFEMLYRVAYTVVIPLNSGITMHVTSITFTILKLEYVGNQLYSSLSLLKRQSLLMLTELPGMLTVFVR